MRTRRRINDIEYTLQGMDTDGRGTTPIIDQECHADEKEGNTENEEEEKGKEVEEEEKEHEYRLRILKMTYMGRG